MSEIWVLYRYISHLESATTHFLKEHALEKIELSNESFCILPAQGATKLSDVKDWGPNDLEFNVLSKIQWS